MRGFWADERVDAGIWSEDSWLYSLSKGLERRLFERADVIVSLTNAGINAIKGFSHVDTSQTEFAMIPTCVNLELFTPRTQYTDDKFTLCYLGSVGTWYLFDEVLNCFSILRESEPNATLKVINRGDHEYIREQLERYEIPESAVELEALEHQEVPAALADVDAGVFFIKPVFSKKGSSPTKLGEFLASGIPCFTNNGVGDVQELLEENEVGVVVEEFNKEQKRNGVEQLRELVQEDNITNRCRTVAEEYYSLENGVAKYDELYRQLTVDT
jgi:glycosyltransferase involved in cell wall biosynthesis